MTKHKKFRYSDVPKSEYFRINLTLPESLDSFLEQLGTTAKMNRGYKLPKTVIVRSLVRVLMLLKPNVDGVKTEDELVKRLKDAIKEYPGG